MKRIRLQVQIMPWQEPGASLTTTPTRQVADLKWIQPCPDHLSIQALTDLILVKWARLCPGLGTPQHRPLNIRNLTTVHGDLLDTEDCVGSIFDDRADFPDRLSSDEVLATSIVRVHRYPPETEDLRNAHRFGSLMPESFARPRKRPPVEATQAAPTEGKVFTSVEGGSDEQGFANPNKRQRVHESFVHESPHSVHGHRPEIVVSDRSYQGSDLLGTQGSIHQVCDSQESYARKQRNPYGSPTSLSTSSPQEPCQRNYGDMPSIPDSPTCRVPVDAEAPGGATSSANRDFTKSPSPELRLSVHSLPESQGITIQPCSGSEKPGPQSSTQSSPYQAPQTAALEEPHDAAQAQENSNLQSSSRSNNVCDMPENPSLNFSSPPISQIQKSNGLQRQPEDIYDDFPSDDETIQEKQQMFSTRRPRTHDTINPQKDKLDGRFLKPPIPARDNRSRAALGERDGFEQRQDTQSPDVQILGSDPQPLNDGSNRTTPLQLDDVGDGSNGSSKKLVHNQRKVDGVLDTDSQRTELPLSDAPIKRPQNCAIPSKNWSYLDTDHPHKRALSQGRKPDCDSYLNSDDHDDAQSIQSSPRAQGSFPSEGQQKQRACADSLIVSPQNSHTIPTPDVGLTAEEVDPSTEQDVTRNEIPESKSGEQLGLQQLEVASRQTAGAPEELVSSQFQSAGPVPPLPNQPIRPIKQTSFKDQSSKERILTEQAKQLMFEKEGATQLQLEKAQKQTKPAASKSRSSEIRTGRPKFTRTPEQKAARRERETRQRRERRARLKAEDQSAKSTRIIPSYSRLFSGDGSTVRACSEHIDTDSEDDKRPSPASTVRSTGQNRKSLTPAMANGSVIKSSTIKGNSISSSPLALKSPVTSGTPLRSALKNNETPSTIRRSVSFVGENESKRPITKPAIQIIPPAPAVPSSDAVNDLNNELALKGFIHSEESKPTNASNNRPNKIANKGVNEKAELQQKQNVTKYTKSQGRAMKSFSTSERVQKSGPKRPADEELHDFESSANENQDNGQAKAGPSSKERNPLGVRSPPSNANLASSQTSLIDPEIVEIDSVNKARASFQNASSSVQFSARKDSPSHSSALAMPETLSASSSSNSGSGSASDSDSDLGSGSESGSDSESEPESSSNSGLDPRLKNAPMTYKYPTFSSQRKMAVPTTPNEKPLDFATPQGPMADPTKSTQKYSSSSDSEESSESSEDQEENKVKTKASPNSSQTRPWRMVTEIPRFRGVLKLAGVKLEPLH
ncbi:hypothetical protein ACLMJK_005796 [Lecanora helva]